MTNPAFIWNKQQCVEAYDELIIKIAMSSYAEIEGREMLKENDCLTKLPEHQITPEIEHEVRKIIFREKRRKFSHNFEKSVYLAVNRVAIIFLLVGVAFIATSVASAEFREAIYKLIFTYEKQYTLVEIENQTSSTFIGSEFYTWQHAYAPTFMPYGYTVSDVVNMSDMNQVVYTNSDGGYIDIHQISSNAGAGIQLDTEQAQVAKRVMINDSDGFLVSKNGINSLSWSIGNTLISIESTEESDVLIKIAQGIMLLK